MEMSFNPDPSKQAQKVIFLRETSVINHVPLALNSNYVEKAASQEHLGIVLDSESNFKEYTSRKIDKANKEISITGTTKIP